MSTLPDTRYRSYSWLKEQIYDGVDYKAIARKCRCSQKTIKDWIYKFQLQDLPKGSGNLSTIFRSCGINGARIPDKARRSIKITRKSRIVVLGASGFVGANLVQIMESRGYKILTPSRSIADALDYSSIYGYLISARPDVVINLAAFVGGIGLNKDNPAIMMYKNLMMGANVVDACYRAGVKKLVHLGSVCSYPKSPKRIPFVEEDLWESRPEPTNEPYGVAKKTIGFMLGAYYQQYNFSSAYLIPTNMYGPCDDFSLHCSHVIPAMINKFIGAKLNGKKVTLWGDGSPSRDFLYVDDCCEAIIQAMRKVNTPDPINIGSGQETTMKQLAEVIASEVSFPGTVIWDKTKPNGQPRRVLNITRAKKRLGFKQKVNLATGVRRTIDWYQSSLL